MRGHRHLFRRRRKSLSKSIAKKKRASRKTSRIKEAIERLRRARLKARRKKESKSTTAKQKELEAKKKLERAKILKRRKEAQVKGKELEALLAKRKALFAKKAKNKAGMKKIFTWGVKEELKIKRKFKGAERAKRIRALWKKIGERLAVGKKEVVQGKKTPVPIPKEITVEPVFPAHTKKTPVSTPKVMVSPIFPGFKQWSKEYGDELVKTGRLTKLSRAVGWALHGLGKYAHEENPIAWFSSAERKNIEAWLKKQKLDKSLLQIAKKYENLSPTQRAKAIRNELGSSFTSQMKKLASVVTQRTENYFKSGEELEQKAGWGYNVISSFMTPSEMEKTMRTRSKKAMAKMPKWAKTYSKIKSSVSKTAKVGKGKQAKTTATKTTAKK